MKYYVTKKARTDIYVQGKSVKKIHENGKHKGQEYIAVDKTQPANKQDRILIKKGEAYYWWQFAFGPKIYSTTPPRRSQLTKSEFLAWLYDMEDETIGKATASSQSDLETLVDEWKDEIEEQRDELQDRLDNMPEQLQDSSPNQERIECLDDWVSELEGVDLTVDEDECKSNAEEEWEANHTAALKEEDPDADQGKDAWIETRTQELIQEAVDDILSELQGCSSNL